MIDFDTKRLLLDAAERLFARQGIDGTSLRHIISDAGVNIASVHYHFGSKEELVAAVLARRLEPLNHERVCLLEEIEATQKKPSLEKILEALIGPALRLSHDAERGGPVFMQLMGRIMTDPNEKLQAMVLRQFNEVAERFTAAFHRALPDLPKVELFWRVHFMVGAMAYTLCDAHRLKFISGGLCDPNDTEGTLRRLVVFLAAGMRASLEGRRR